MDNIIYNLFLGENIITKEFGELIPPTISEIVKYGITNYNKLGMPLTLKKFFLTIDNPDMFKDLKNLDLFFLKDENNDYIFNIELDNNKIPYINLLLDNMKFYFRTNKIEVFEEHLVIMVNEKIIIDRDNYDNYVDLIYKINKQIQPKPEEKPKFENDRQRDVYEKIMSGRSRKQQENSVELITIMNIVVNGGESYISHKEVGNMNMYQLISTYETIVKSRSFDDSFKMYSSGNFEFKDGFKSERFGDTFKI